MFVYLVALDETVAALLIKETGSRQAPIYYVSRALQGRELNYSKIEKLAFALVTVSHRLR